jgi:hypothetical protein
MVPLATTITKKWFRNSKFFKERDRSFSKGR